ncbi:MAG: B12-binding domain-containing radical SAM protein [Patescibacteria group bacterium]|nr:B12-binding domain-containing radical SAM protein [Patescibacteria group bacterium]
MIATRERVKVLMVNPPMPDSFWGYRSAVRMFGRRAAMPPLGLATIAAMLPSDRFEVMPIVDLNLIGEELSDAQIMAADMVMFTAMIVQRDALAQLVTRVKNLGGCVVVGGPYATAYIDQVSAMGVDHLVLGEAEVTLAPFAEDWLAGCATPIYTEKSMHRRVQVPLTRERKPLISQTPVPRWDLLRLGDYTTMALQASRGCPFDCEFCDRSIVDGRFPRCKTPAQMVAELESLYQAGWRGPVFIVDDNFIGNRGSVRKLLLAVLEWQRRWGYPFDFFTEASMDLASRNMRDILGLMVAAGFVMVFCGIESPDPVVLEAMGKRQNLAGDLLEKVRILQQAGLEVTAGIIVGSDGEKPGAIERTFQFIQEAGIVVAMPGILTAIRRTRLYARLQVEGRLRGDPTGNNTHGFRPNFQPKMDEDELVEGYVSLLEALFCPVNYYARCRILFSERGPHHQVSQFNRNGLLATARICYRNLLRRPSFEFIKFIGWAIFRRPRSLPAAINHAVKLCHFQELTEAAVAAHRYPEVVAGLMERLRGKVACLRGSTRDRLRRLSALEQQVLAEAKRRYGRLHSGFRGEAAEVLANWQTRLQAWVREQQALIYSRSL